MRHVTRVLTMIVTAVLIAAGVLALTAWRPALNPFREAEVDRTGPAVLQSLTRIREFHAASAHYEVVVDLEKDVRYLPGWISGERVLYVGKGDVDAVVDFGGLDEDSVTLSEDRTSVSVELPRPTVEAPVLDLENSYVADRDQGLVERFRGSGVEREAQLRAVEQITTAANGTDDLTRLAEENTVEMLNALFGSLGFTEVLVSFGAGLP
ncbi:DUF4230 domain-containing protein [Ornithinimicrobium tianjinense]|uniref:DUF4230 domain-containing protein n=1 Tax=Ornithinimicrobium tianjinense TaxID=1195761 RepID=UPI001668B8F3|nr:DUF4230 domain-containing protein [Ornithinimicrobium tianjinense]